MPAPAVTEVSQLDIVGRSGLWHAKNTHSYSTVVSMLLCASYPLCKSLMSLYFHWHLPTFESTSSKDLSCRDLRRSVRDGRQLLKALFMEPRSHRQPQPRLFQMAQLKLQPTTHAHRALPSLETRQRVARSPTFPS